MKRAIRKKLMFLKHGHMRRIDPRAQVAGAFDLLQICLSEPNVALRPKSDEFRAAWYAVQILRRIVVGLRDSAFWRDLRVPMLSDSLIMIREESNVTSRKNLFSERVTISDIIRAMDGLRSAVRRMNLLFQTAHCDPLDELEEVRVKEVAGWGERKAEQEEYEAIDDEAEEEEERERDWTIGRLRCAALLPYLAKQMREIWVPLKKSIPKPRKNTNSYDSHPDD